MFGAVQIVHELHPEVTAPSELQTFVPESARARVHCWLVRGAATRYAGVGCLAARPRHASHESHMLAAP